MVRLVRRGIAVVALVAGTTLGAQSPTPYQITAVDNAHGSRPFTLLWPGGAPGAVGSDAVDQPKITPYLAPVPGNGAAVIVIPGGGYAVVAADHEGKAVAEWLNTLGVSAFVLQYRLGPRYHHPAPLQDVQRAIRIVRSRAAEWQLDPARIGVLGFSAGGHLAATAATHFDAGVETAATPIDRASSRPDFAILAYPVITMRPPFAHAGSRTNLLGNTPSRQMVDSLSNERQVTSRTPPTFIFHTADDNAVPVENAELFADALRRAHVPVELHVFEHGAHGVGLAPNDPVLSQWPVLAAAWMRARNIVVTVR
jgi:acetyl esterase/lipase